MSSSREKTLSKRLRSMTKTMFLVVCQLSRLAKDQSTSVKRPKILRSKRKSPTLTKTTLKKQKVLIVNFQVKKMEKRAKRKTQKTQSLKKRSITKGCPEKYSNYTSTWKKIGRGKNSPLNSKRGSMITLRSIQQRETRCYNTSTKYQLNMRAKSELSE